MKLHWTLLGNDDIEQAIVQERFHILVWRFGNSYQCKVVVDYPYARDTHIGAGPSTGIGLPLSKTKREAGRRGLEWVEKYLKEGPLSAEDSISECFKYYPDLFRTRADVLNQLFFVIGNEYSWLDGALINTDQEPRQEPSKRLTGMFEQKMRDLLDGIDPNIQKSLLKSVLKEPFEPPSQGPLEDKGATREFYPISESYSNICTVPPDIRPDWLKVAIEAADLLETRSVDPSQQEVGEKLAKQLRLLQ